MQIMLPKLRNLKKSGQQRLKCFVQSTRNTKVLEKQPPKPGDSSEGNMNIQSAEGSVTMSYWPYGTRPSAAWVAYSNTLLSHSLFFFVTSENRGRMENNRTFYPEDRLQTEVHRPTMLSEALRAFTQTLQAVTLKKKLQLHHDRLSLYPFQFVIH